LLVPHASARILQNGHSLRDRDVPRGQRGRGEGARAAERAWRVPCRAVVQRLGVRGRARCAEAVRSLTLSRTFEPLRAGRQCYLRRPCARAASQPRCPTPRGRGRHGHCPARRQQRPSSRRPARRSRRRSPPPPPPPPVAMPCMRAARCRDSWARPRLATRPLVAAPLRLVEDPLERGVRVPAHLQAGESQSRA